MKLKAPLSIPSREVLNWKSACLVEKIGKWPLIAFLLPILLIAFWAGYLLPENEALRHELADMQKQLSVPLPITAAEGESEETKLSADEYQKIKTLFDIFNKYQMSAEGSRYQFSSQDETAKKTLRLDIPLQGSWLSLANALKEITLALPVTVDVLNVKRLRPETQQLTIMLQLTLHKGGK